MQYFGSYSVFLLFLLLRDFFFLQAYLWVNAQDSELFISQRND